MKKFIVIILCCFDCRYFKDIFLYQGSLESLVELLSSSDDSNFIIYDYETFTEVKRI